MSFLRDGKPGWFNQIVSTVFSGHERLDTEEVRTQAS